MKNQSLDISQETDMSHTDEKITCRECDKPCHKDREVLYDAFSVWGNRLGQIACRLCKCVKCNPWPGPGV